MAKGAIQSRKKKARKASKEQQKMKLNPPFKTRPKKKDKRPPFYIPTNP